MLRGYWSSLRARTIIINGGRAFNVPISNTRRGCVRMRKEGIVDYPSLRKMAQVTLKLWKTRTSF
jgi:hypothetical protein